MLLDSVQYIHGDATYASFVAEFAYHPNIDAVARAALGLSADEFEEGWRRYVESKWLGSRGN